MLAGQGHSIFTHLDETQLIAGPLRTTGKARIGSSTLAATSILRDGERVLLRAALNPSTSPEKVMLWHPTLW